MSTFPALMEAERSLQAARMKVAMKRNEVRLGLEFIGAGAESLDRLVFMAEEFGPADAIRRFVDDDSNKLSVTASTYPRARAMGQALEELYDAQVEADLAMAHRNDLMQAHDPDYARRINFGAEEAVIDLAEEVVRFPESARTVACQVEWVGREKRRQQDLTSKEPDLDQEM